MKPEISCQNFEAELQNRMDRRWPVSGDRGLAEHAAVCQSCADLFCGFRELEEGLVALGQSTDTAFEFSSPPNSSTHLYAAAADSQIDGVQHSLIHGRYGVIGLIATIAAVLLIALGISGSLVGPESVVAKKMGDEFAKSELPDTSLESAPIARRSKPESAPRQDEVTETLAKKQAAAEALPIESWNQLSEQLTSSVYYRYSAELPGVRPIQSSIDIGVDLFQKTFQPKKQRSPNKRPNLGMFDFRSFRQA